MNHYRRQGNTALNVALCLVVVGVVGVTVFPVFMHRRSGTGGGAPCPSNLKQIGTAMKQYLEDWDQTFPTNRMVTAAGVPTDALPVEEAPLPIPADGVYYQDPVTGKPSKITRCNGALYITWVGALYDHIEAVANDQDDASSVWKCPAATRDYSTGTDDWGNRAEVTYVFNYNLLEQREDVVRDASHLMMLRETDRLVVACARGGKLVGSVMKPVKGPKDIPSAPFLCVVDENMPGERINSRPHGSGSNVLLADGHVKVISSQAFGPDNKAVWSKAYQTWVNGGYPNGVVSVMPYGGCDDE